jgi:dihydrofolate reductase
MRKVILQMMVTLDGFIEGANGELDWFRFDEEMWENVHDLLSTVDTALFGRRSYQAFESYWPAAAKNPSSSKGEIDFAHWIENSAKVVFSKTLEKAEWQNSRLVKENIAEEVSKMKQQPGKDLLILGGAGLAQTFMKHDLIDDYRIRVHPIVLGRGIPLFRDLNERHTLKLIKAKTFNSGVVELHYEAQRN